MVWTDDPAGKCIFWLNGMAGTGKSTISRTVAQRFKDLGVLGASFFFKRGERDRGHADLFVTTIAAQLISVKPDLEPHIKDALRTDQGLAGKALREQFEKLILQPLERVYHDLRNPVKIMLVVDALDECDHDGDIKAIIYLLSQTKTLGSVHMRVFVTSRPELPIRLGFKDIQGRYQDVALHQVPEPIIEHDISKFLEHELANIRDEYNKIQELDVLRLPSDWPGEHVVQRLVYMAMPLFIYAATVCRFVCDSAWSDPDGQLRKVLEYQTSDQTSELDRLDATYIPILSQLVLGRTGPGRSRLVEEFRDIVGPIVLLAEPLSMSSLSSLLTIPMQAIAGRLNSLHFCSLHSNRSRRPYQAIPPILPRLPR